MWRAEGGVSGASQAVAVGLGTDADVGRSTPAVSEYDQGRQGVESGQCRARRNVGRSCLSDVFQLWSSLLTAGGSNGRCDEADQCGAHFHGPGGSWNLLQFAGWQLCVPVAVSWSSWSGIGWFAASQLCHAGGYVSCGGASSCYSSDRDHIWRWDFLGANSSGSGGCQRLAQALRRGGRCRVSGVHSAVRAPEGACGGCQGH
mmetsp:Transcript_3957/g.8593  ORF Transcript_3957/g.8593 Transcript_3957/m.8593 type:complete len:202 (+) Transcript_3957:190-795(+)